MSNTFREYLRTIASGTHTSKDLSREDAHMATRLMLLQEATPAQIGAFMIAHRIKRPSVPEIAGMLDAYEELGPLLSTDDLKFNYPLTVFGTPYDGRSRTAPVLPLTMLILAAAGVPVVAHGGDTMPTKYGIPLVEIWRGLGLDFSTLSLAHSDRCLRQTGLGFIYTPRHFRAVHELTPYREQIGKRPPLATIELIWSPYRGNIHQVCGFVHPPTEERFQETLNLRGVNYFTMVKGLEGSCDLPCSRTGIIGAGNPTDPPSFDRLFINPRDYSFTTQDTELSSLDALLDSFKSLLNGQNNDLTDAAIYNAGFYLWRCNVCESLKDGFTEAESYFKSGKALAKLREIDNLLNP
ncbi:MAG: Anthranilate phosphoribosyltransferase [Chroococcopsis gigantea SAG 12.99]|jgi:anthranilate phosphoribosyltransferase|nr:Anthranilate phosphoribosyltransferase [Chroococcopsis gigantea SAG 12.99]